MKLDKADDAPLLLYILWCTAATTDQGSVRMDLLGVKFLQKSHMNKGIPTILHHTIMDSTVRSQS